MQDNMMTGSPSWGSLGHDRNKSAMMILCIWHTHILLPVGMGAEMGINSSYIHPARDIHW